MSEEDIVASWLNFEAQLEIIKVSFENQHFQTAYKEAERLVKYLRIFAIRDIKREVEKNVQDKQI